MHYNGRQIKLMVLQGPVTNGLLNSSHKLSKLVSNGRFPEIHETDETAVLTGRTRIGSVIQKNIPYSNNQCNHHLEFAVNEAINLSEKGADLVLVSYCETPVEKIIKTEYFSAVSEQPKTME